MARFDPRQRRWFSELRALCYEGLDSAGLRRALAEHLSCLVASDAYCFMEVDPDLALPVHAVSRGWPGEAQRLLVEEVLLASPAADPPAMLRGGLRTVEVEELLADPRADPYVRSHLGPFGYRYELLSLGRAHARPWVLLTLSRHRRTGPFAPWHKRLLDALAPHVAAGVRAASIREAALASRDAPSGLVVVDRSRRVEVTNAAGEAWLRASRQGSPGWSMALDTLHALLEAPQEADGQLAVPALLVRHPRTGALHRLACEREGGPSERTLVLIEPIAGAESAQVLERLGLSPQEARVVRGVLLGRTSRELARELGCTQETVRVHLHHAYERLGVCSRRVLARRLAAPGTLRPDPGEDAAELAEAVGESVY